VAVSAFLEGLKDCISFDKVAKDCLIAIKVGRLIESNGELAANCILAFWCKRRKLTAAVVSDV
jgi:hypothetical protein